LPDENDITMKNCKNAPKLHDVDEAIEAHFDRFIAEVKAAGYAYDCQSNAPAGGQPQGYFGGSSSSVPRHH
jgi:hypothetical protein